MADNRFDLITIGNYTKDTIVTRSGTRHVHGGGFNYAARAAAAAGLKVGAVTRLAEEDREMIDQLEAAGVTVFPRFTRSSTIMRLEYPTDNVDERILTVADTAGSVEPDQVEGLEAPAFVVSPSIRGEVGIDVLQAIRRPGVLVGLDVQGYVRIRHDNGLLEHTRWPEIGETLALVDVLKTDAVEAESLTGSSNHEEAARILAGYGPREVVLTHRDGLLVLADGDVYEARFTPRELRGRSGRGDTCLGSYLTWRLQAGPSQAILWAAAATSLKLEKEGPLTATRDEILAAFEAKGGVR
ncbi:MAG TPA: PfkB family carbohydrate kinase [Thermoanaerobaculia bacterium]|jgi:sugar/nucleoside kinase (ribokinase family)|nr:PfkB family carbohydrate kinase [Thermoanaerobaculia bacterium]